MVDGVSYKQEQGQIPKSHGRSTEVTGLGMIAALIGASWTLVTDGTLRLSEFLIFAAFLLAGAGGLVWRILKLPLPRSAGSQD